MPDLSRCKYVGDKLCCWDKVGKRFVEVQIVPIDPVACDEYYCQVVASFMEDVQKEANNDA